MILLLRVMGLSYIGRLLPAIGGFAYIVVTPRLTEWVDDPPPQAAALHIPGHSAIDRMGG